MDNPKALVTTPRHDDRPAVFNDRLNAFAKYWGFKPRACRTYRARTKGKVERSVGYVKHNALAGRSFASWGSWIAIWRCGWRRSPTIGHSVTRAIRP